MAKQERTHWANFPSDIGDWNYFVTGFFQGEQFCTSKGLTADHFDTISFIRRSPSAKDSRDIIHCIGHRSLEKQETFLTLKRRKYVKR